MRNIVFAAVVALLLIAILPGCGKSEPTETTPTVTAPAFAQSITEAMLKALSAGDYQSYSLYFDQDMAARNSEELFGSFKDFYSKKIGTYVSLVLSDVKVESDKTTVVYKAKYTMADEVTVTIVFTRSGGTVAVNDLILNSPELWQH
jgi:hypothetical protein